MKNNKKIPQLRFPEFEGKWVEENLGNIVTFSKGRGLSENLLKINENPKTVKDVDKLSVLLIFVG